jgi:transposase
VQRRRAQHLGNPSACRPPASPTSDTIWRERAITPLPRSRESEENDALRRPRARSFRNDAPGHAAPRAWAEGYGPAGAALGFCPESTGAAGRALATARAEAGQYVSAVNPARIKYAGRLRGQGHQTDPADARLLAEYAQRERPPAGRPPRARVQEIQALRRRRDALRQLAAREKGRPAAPGLTPALVRSPRRTVRWLAQEADRLQAQAGAVIAADAARAAARALLESIPGIGAVTASTLLAELPAPAHFAPAQQAAAYAGLAPREYRSGTSVRKRPRLSQAGSARLRKALSRPTLAAIRFNPLLRGFFERLVAAGKARMAAVGACLRKLLLIAYGVLKSRVPFDPSWARKQPS